MHVCVWWRWNFSVMPLNVSVGRKTDTNCQSENAFCFLFFPLVNVRLLAGTTRTFLFVSLFQVTTFCVRTLFSLGVWPNETLFLHHCLCVCVCLSRTEAPHHHFRHTRFSPSVGFAHALVLAIKCLHKPNFITLISLSI